MKKKLSLKVRAVKVLDNQQLGLAVGGYGTDPITGTRYTSTGCSIGS